MAEAAPRAEDGDRARSHQRSLQDGAEYGWTVWAFLFDWPQGRSDDRALPGIVRRAEPGGIAPGAHAAGRLSGAYNFLPVDHRVGTLRIDHEGLQGFVGSGDRTAFRGVEARDCRNPGSTKGSHASAAIPGAAEESLPVFLSYGSPQR